MKISIFHRISVIAIAMEGISVLSFIKALAPYVIFRGGILL